MSPAVLISDLAAEKPHTYRIMGGLPPQQMAINQHGLPLCLQKLFKKVIAWHCLGCVWGKNKKEGRAPTVKATVDQFNAVSLRVTSTILTCSSSKSSGPNTRGKYISWWISVAQVRLQAFLLSSVKKVFIRKHELSVRCERKEERASATVLLFPSLPLLHVISTQKRAVCKMTSCHVYLVAGVEKSEKITTARRTR